MNKRMLVLVSVLMLVLGCGDVDSPKDPIVRSWGWVGMSDRMGGSVVTSDTDGLGRIWFNSDGTFSNTQVFTYSSGTWISNGSSYTLRTQNNTYQALLSGGTLYISISGFIMCFE